MSLNRLFWTVSIMLMLLFSALVARIVSAEWGDYQRGARSVEALRIVQLAMIATEKLSVERGPSNAVMGAGEVEPDLKSELEQKRLQSDRSLDDLLVALRAEVDVNYRPVIDKADDVRLALEGARKKVDVQVALPLSRRTSTGISAAVAGMVELNAMLIVVVSDVSAIAVRADPELLNGLAGMRIASSLREYAGQVGSRFTSPIAMRRPLTKVEVIEFGKLYGRVGPLRTLLDLQLRSYKASTAFRSTLAEVDAQYFNNGFLFLDGLLQIGLSSGTYGVDMSELARRYVPTMEPILRLRDVIYVDLIAQAEIRNREARNLLLGIVVLALFAFIFFSFLLYLVRQRVVQPILRATNLVVALADGRLDVPLPQSWYGDEMGDMLRALHVLKERSLERLSLASEREALIEKLQISSSTDFLTGALNRRAFFTRGEQQMAIARRYKRSVALILLDIDHFKQINDGYGHLAGDNILRGAMQMVGRLLRNVDVLARYGGEEFVILLPEADAGQACIVAEKLRAMLMSHKFAIDVDKEISITASFGVSALLADETLDILIGQADEALYLAKKNGRNRVVCADEWRLSAADA